MLRGRERERQILNVRDINVGDRIEDEAGDYYIVLQITRRNVTLWDVHDKETFDVPIDMVVDMSVRITPKYWSKKEVENALYEK